MNPSTVPVEAAPEPATPEDVAAARATLARLVGAAEDLAALASFNGPSR